MVNSWVSTFQFKPLLAWEWLNDNIITVLSGNVERVDGGLISRESKFVAFSFHYNSPPKANAESHAVTPSLSSKGLWINRMNY